VDDGALEELRTLAMEPAAGCADWSGWDLRELRVPQLTPPSVLAAAGFMIPKAFWCAGT
jgi:hypothetical protein